jgi:hypothetical protein
MTTMTPVSKPTGTDWQYVNYVPHLDALSSKASLQPEYVLPIGTMPATKWPEVGARFWLDGCQQGQRPASHVPIPERSVALRQSEWRDGKRRRLQMARQRV